MRGRIDLSLLPVRLESGSPEERAGFGTIKLETDEHILTEGFDQHIGAPREGPLVSGYHLAEWLAWNWWRLRWEWWHHSHATSDVVDDWDFAHRMSTVGEGYEWPNIAIASDGFQTALVSESTGDHREVSFRYFGAPVTLIPAKDMEAAVDQFVTCMVARMDGEGLRGTNLHRLWDELNCERQEPETASFRRLEARLGYDPDEAVLNEEWQADAARLGGDALEELAADAAYIGASADMMSADQITDMADSWGFDAARQEATFVLSPSESTQEWGDVPAWRIGEEYARRLHLQEKLDKENPISNKLLAELSGVTEDAISHRDSLGAISFFLDRNHSGARMVLGSRWETGRRFALARIIGDRLFAWKDKMYPATRSHTYRQQVQRSFAAEFLSPFEAVNDMLGKDDSEERQSEIAVHYKVSSMAIKTMLVNKGKISRDEATGIVHRQYEAIKPGFTD